MKTVDKRIKVLNMIAKDMENDAKEFDGKPFNGKTVATYFGNQGAAIATIANIVKSQLEDIEELETERQGWRELIAQKDKLIKKLEDALRKTQFGFNHRRCPVCAGMSPNGETDMVHTKECPIGKALEEVK